MAKAIAQRPQHKADTDEAAVQAPAVSDTSLTSDAAYAEPEFPARILTPPAPIPPEPFFGPQPEVVTMPMRLQSENSPPLRDEKQRSASRDWRAEAWERERERGLRENRTDIAGRRRSSATV